MEQQPIDNKTAVCALCSKELDQEDMIFIEDKWICGTCKPTFVQMVREGVSTADLTVARRNKVLIMGKNTSLPDRCLKCNAPTQKRLKKKLYWHNPIFYFLVLLNLLIYALVAILVRKRANIEIPLCDQHLAQRKTSILISWVIVLAAIALIITGFMTETAGFLLAGFPLLLVALIYSAIKTPVVTPRKMDKEYIWLRGAGKEYLNSLPEFANYK